MTAMHRTSRALCCVLALAWLGVAQAQIGPLEDLDAFPSADLKISDGKKVRYVFRVWLADTPQRQAQGLMFVRSLPELRGMLFGYALPRTLGLWMKNT
jgi:hypothetical protein